MCVVILIVLTNGLYYYLVRYLCCKQQKRLKLKQKKREKYCEKNGKKQCYENHTGLQMNLRH